MIYCANNNMLYSSAVEAARELGLDKSSVSNVLSGRRKSANSYLLARVDDTTPEALEAARRWMLYSAYKIII